MRMVLLATMVALAAISSTQTAQPPKVTLKVGSKAPSLAGVTWVKGTKPTLTKGNFYVVEFWATWCPPCVQSIPHLTELQKKYKDKVTIMGISVAEGMNVKKPAEILPKVQKFVKDMGDKMNYTVGSDNLENKTLKEWMAAAGVSGIPIAFVVDKKGEIAWIGSPFALDEPLAKILKG